MPPADHAQQLHVDHSDNPNLSARDVNRHGSNLSETQTLSGSDLNATQHHYVRQASNLPCAGRRVRLRLLVRRFRCGTPGCLREGFAERFDATLLAERARRTGRLKDIVHHLGLAMGGRPGAGFA